METPVNHWEYNSLKELIESKTEGLKTDIESKVDGLKAEDKRLNERVKILENTSQQISAINITLQKQSDNLSEMSSNISRMAKKQEEEAERIKTLENKDAEKWKSTVKNVIQIGVGLIGGLLLAWAKNLLGL